MYNHGTGRVDPRPLPSTVRVGSHDHFDGDSGHWRDHAIPGTIDGGTIHFRNVTSEHTIVAWQPPDQGLYKWDVLGFRVEWRLEGQPWPQPGEGGATEQGGAGPTARLAVPSPGPREFRSDRSLPVAPGAWPE